MIAVLFWLAQFVAGPVAPSSPAGTAPGNAPWPQLSPAIVLQRYAAALHKIKEPRVISFDYTLEQTGARTLYQTHRVFRAGSDERDETLTVDGKRLSPPKVRIFRGRRDRYTVGLLAPRIADYTFAYIGSRKDGHHVDYVFRLTPRTVRPFAVTDVTIDGVRFLPLAIGFSTGSNDGAGSIAFGSNARWWVPYVAQARATVAADLATEKLTFYTYRFPPTLPPSTFSQARRPVLPVTVPERGPTRPQLGQPVKVPPGTPAGSHVVAPGRLPFVAPGRASPSASSVRVSPAVPIRSALPVPVRSPLLVPVRSALPVRVRSALPLPIRSALPIPIRSPLALPVRSALPVPVRSATSVPVPPFVPIAPAPTPT